jgi:hypothetical protein
MTDPHLLTNLKEFHMGQMFTRLFSAFTMLFSMLENLAAAGNSLTTVARDTAGQYEDDAVYQRKINHHRKMKEYEAVASKEGIDLKLPTTTA